MAGSSEVHDMNREQPGTVRKNAMLPDTGGGGSTTAAGKAFQLLDALAAADEPLSLAELAILLEQPKPSIHRLLHQLEGTGLVKRDMTGKRFLVGDRTTDFALRALGAATRMPPVRTVLEQLVARVNESCNLGVPDRLEVVYVARVECNWPLRLHLGVGSRVPLHCTATGKLFLAHMTPARRRRLLQHLPLTAYTPYTLTDPQQLERSLHAARDDGYVINHQEYMLGLIGVAVPVFGPDRKMCAGLAVHAPEARFSLQDAADCVPALRETADVLSGLLH
jgi:DNA-binding IclR family transcriptional regulator